VKRVIKVLQAEEIINLITQEFQTSFDFVENHLQIEDKEALLL
jgi:hypothetical protein